MLSLQLLRIYRFDAQNSTMVTFFFDAWINHIIINTLKKKLKKNTKDARFVIEMNAYYNHNIGGRFNPPPMLEMNHVSTISTYSDAEPVFVHCFFFVFLENSFEILQFHLFVLFIKI